MLILSIPFGIVMSVPKKKCHPDRSVAKWRDLLFLLSITTLYYAPAEQPQFD